MQNAYETLLTLLTMQADTNAKVDTDWRDRQNNWHRAIWTECAELLDELPWKWWSKPVPKAGEHGVLIELVDILHFGLSQTLQLHGDPDDAALTLVHLLEEQKPNIDGDQRTLVAIVEELAFKSAGAAASGKGRFAFETFLMAVKAAGYTFVQVEAAFHGKKVLNDFRQLNGYKTGEYQKTWGGVEDNEAMLDIALTFPVDDQFYPSLMEQLADQYALQTERTAVASISAVQPQAGEAAIAAGQEMGVDFGFMDGDTGEAEKA